MGVEQFRRGRFDPVAPTRSAKPPIWRRLRLASDLSLAELHDIVQIAMGWMDSHLHHFQMGPNRKDHSLAPFLTDYDPEHFDAEVNNALQDRTIDLSAWHPG